jgi:hypothetical protein
MFLEYLLVWREMTLEEAQISDTHSLKDIIEINLFVDLALSLREKYVKTFLYAHTP